MKMIRLLLLPLLLCGAQPLEASTTRDAMRLLTGVVILWAAILCFQNARTAATNLAADPAFIDQLRNNSITRQLLQLLPEKTLSDLTTSGFEAIRVSLGSETTQMRIAKLCGWSMATLITTYAGFAEFLKGLRGEYQT